jgi:radical SAM protein with 4Fe4S-binding SPASM domain
MKKGYKMEKVLWRLKAGAFRIISRSDTLCRLIRKIAKTDAILNLSIHLSERCNLDCDYCYEKRFSGKDMPVEKARHLIDESISHGIKRISFLGGEALLHPGLWELMDHCAKNRMQIRLFTNGTLLDDEKIRKLRKYQDIFLVFKYDTESMFRKKGGGSHLDLIRKNIRLATGSGIRSYASIVVHKKNVKHLPRLLSEVEELGAYPITLRHIPVTDPSYDIDKADWRSAQDDYFTWMGRHYGVSMAEAKIYTMDLGKIKGYLCPSFNCSLSVNIDGTVVPCAIAPPEFSIGNINEVPFSKIVERHNKKKARWFKPEGQCKGCKRNKICHGGCKLHSFLYHKGKNRTDPFCDQTESPILKI